MLLLPPLPPGSHFFYTSLCGSIMKFVRTKGLIAKRTALKSVKGNSTKKCAKHASKKCETPVPDTTSIETIFRPTQQQHDLANCKLPTDVLPYKLRAKIVKNVDTDKDVDKHNYPKLMQNTAGCSSLGGENCESGYRIVNMALLLSEINKFMVQHNKNSSCSRLVIGTDPSKEKCIGLGVCECFLCISCGYCSSISKLYHEVSLRAERHGRYADINLRFAVGLQLAGIGNSAARDLLSVLDIPVPAKSSLQRYTNIVGDHTFNLSNVVMSENREKLKEVLKAQEPHVSFITESDTAYNNAPKGRSFSQPGSQAFCPLIEKNTTENLIINYSIANKLCKRCQLYGRGHTGHCSANYPEGAPIGNAEGVLGTKNMDTLGDLSPDIVVTDNDGKICSGMNKSVNKTKRIVKEDCRIHVSRGQRRLGYRIKWSQSFAGKSQKERQSFISAFLECVVKRCSGELFGARKAATGNTLISLVAKARDTILPCFVGDHSMCTHSFVCPKHFRRKPHCRHLPKRRYLRNMTDEDKTSFEKLLDYKLSAKMVQRQLHNLSTNASEACHKRIFRSLPKDNTFSRNVYGRVATQIVVASLGKNEGVKRTCGSLKIPLSETGPGVKTLTQLTHCDEYHKRLRSARNTKVRRKIKDKERRRTRSETGSLYHSEHLHPHMCKEHSYGRTRSKPVLK